MPTIKTIREWLLIALGVSLIFFGAGYLQGLSYEECLSKGNSEKTCEKATLN